MKGKLVERVAGVLLVAAMALAGCAITPDESGEPEADEAVAALVVVDDGSSTGGVVVAPQQATQTGSSLSGTLTGADQMGDPEPLPWSPARETPAPGDPSGPVSQTKR